MEMDIYEHQSFMSSISNLIMLKQCYDAGVDLSGLPTNSYFVDIQYDYTAMEDIFFYAINELFDNVHYIDFEGLDALDEDIQGALEHYGDCENYVLIDDSNINAVLNSKYGEDMRKLYLIDNPSFDYAEADIIEIPNRNMLAVKINYFEMLHELIEVLIRIRGFTKKTIKLLESEKHGFLDQNKRSA